MLHFHLETTLNLDEENHKIFSYYLDLLINV
ncbi:hypothetical protein SSU98_2108 [Streptococcus suis 98HAH33]|nr:hypothetical protein SSU05_2102 [Streptococcus suis 05ZYH33]ABP93267.1 hypothetical protein SSU98_2108 [Streptococcus suis 98HAH33]